MAVRPAGLLAAGCKRPSGMSEAELHVMRGRLHAGLMNKARRGELFLHAPMGYTQSHPPRPPPPA
jgi:hypothetical protein